MPKHRYYYLRFLFTSFRKSLAYPTINPPIKLTIIIGDTKTNQTLTYHFITSEPPGLLQLFPYLQTEESL